MMRLRPRTAVALCAGLLLAILAAPASGTQEATPTATTQGTIIVPTVKGFVVSRSDFVLTVADGQKTRMRVVLTTRTKVSGRRDSIAAIALNDLVRADGTAATDGSLEALHVEVVLTGEPHVISRKKSSLGNFVLDWLLNGGPSISLP